jgi:hypothetical protein
LVKGFEVLGDVVFAFIGFCFGDSFFSYQVVVGVLFSSHDLFPYFPEALGFGASFIYELLKGLIGFAPVFVFYFFAYPFLGVDVRVEFFWLA